ADHAHWYALGYATYVAIRIFQNGLIRRRRIEPQQENLLFIDIASLEWQHLQYCRSARVEFKRLITSERVARERHNIGFQFEAAAHTRRQIMCEVKNPVFLVGPAPRPM